MDRNEIESRAANIMRHIERKGPVAVFVINGVVRTARLAGELSNAAIANNARSFIGVYDNRACEEWIAEDIDYVVNPKDRQSLAA